MGNSFIEIYDNALSSEKCEKIINFIDKSQDIIKFSSNEKSCWTFKDTFFSNNDAISILVKEALFRCIDNYNLKYKSLSNYIRPWSLCNSYSIQKYITESDGYKSWHTEAGGKETSNRIGVWTIYLNNAKSGTQFIHYPTVSSKQGRCVIFPAGWTHVHRSEPNKGLKYIITGWITYD